LRQTSALFKRELLGYFVSPLAYGIGALFLVAQGIAFFTLVRALSDPAAPASYGAVLRRFFGGGALYWAFALNLPALLTMRLVAEERREGTLEALLTAPVTATRVIAGKYLAALVFYLFLWLPTLLHVGLIAAAAPEGGLDFGPVLTAYLGVLVTGAGFLAVGVLASSLTRHQLLAAALTYVALAALLVLGSLPELDRLTGAAGFATSRGNLESALAYVDLRRHMDDFARGIIDTRWLVLYASGALTCLLLATLALERKARGRGRSARGALPGVVLLALGGLVLANVVAARHPRRGDATHSQIYSLSPRTLAVARALPADVQVVVLDGLPAVAEIYDDIDELLLRLEHAARGRLTVVHVDPIDDPRRLAELAARHGFLPADLEKGGAVLVQSGARTHALALTDLVDFGRDAQGAGVVTGFRGEAALLGALLDVTQPARPRVCWAAGHGEGALDPDYRTLAARLGEHGFASAPATLADDALRDCALVLVAGPSTPPADAETAALGRYLDHGGAALLLIGSDADAGLAGLTERRGIALGDRVVVDPADPLGSPRRWRTETGYGDHPASRPFRGRRATVWDRPREITPLAIDGTSTAALVSSSEQGWAESDRAGLAGLLPPSFDPATDARGPIAIAAAAELPGGGRLIVAGDPDAFAERAAAAPGRDNLDLAVTWVAWLAHRAPLVDLGPRTPEQIRLTLTPAQVRRVGWATVVALPLALLALGLLVWWRRRA